MNTSFATTNPAPNSDNSQRAQALLESQKQILKMINDDRPLGEILERICIEIERQAEGMLCSILLLDAAGEHLLHGAAPSLPEDYCEAIHGITIGPAVGSCGTAAFSGQPCYVGDISTHANWAAFRELAFVKHGLQACWSTPIRSYEGKTLATFAIYYRQQRMPGMRDRKLIDFTAHLVSLAINRQRDRDALQATA